MTSQGMRQCLGHCCVNALQLSTIDDWQGAQLAPVAYHCVVYTAVYMGMNEFGACLATFLRLMSFSLLMLCTMPVRVKHACTLTLVRDSAYFPKQFEYKCGVMELL